VPPPELALALGRWRHRPDRRDAEELDHERRHDAEAVSNRTSDAHQAEGRERAEGEGGDAPPRASRADAAHGLDDRHYYVLGAIELLVEAPSAQRARRRRRGSDVGDVRQVERDAEGHEPHSPATAISGHERLRALTVRNAW
jgi:hypothetical protein